MDKLTRNDLLSLEQYAAQRSEFRGRALAHKRLRTVHLGEHVTLLFEDRITVQYQVQEMLRIERIFEADGVEEELGAYNPLIPDGSNLKATMLIEFADEQERRRRLAALGGIEHRVYAEVAGHARAFAIADEDLPRSEQSKTSAVHFLRFEFAPAAIAALRDGAPLAFGVDDQRLPAHADLDPAQRAVLSSDFA